MTKYDKNLLATKLLENSKISGVELLSKSLNITKKGHGLFVLSDKNDQYIDLRLLAQKPYWGHTHPLETQWEFDKQIQEKKSHLPHWQSFISEDLQESVLEVIKIDESFLLLTKSEQRKKLDAIKKKASEKEVVIWEKDLILAGENLFYTQEIKSQKVLEITYLDIFLMHAHNEELNHTISNRDFAFLRYNEKILFNENGKINHNHKIIDQYIILNKLESKCSRQGHYLEVKTHQIQAEDFLKHGLLIEKTQILPDRVILCFPSACTKDELLDSLERLKAIIT